MLELVNGIFKTEKASANDFTQLMLMLKSRGSFLS